MNYYEQLRTLLWEVPEIEKDLKIKLSIIWDCNMYSAWTDYRDIGERHIRMYCEKNDILYSYHNKQWFFVIELEDINDWIDININYLKDFHEQDEKVYKQLIEYFKWLKN